MCGSAIIAATPLAESVISVTWAAFPRDGRDPADERAVAADHRLVDAHAVGGSLSIVTRPYQRGRRTDDHAGADRRVRPDGNASDCP